MQDGREEVQGLKSDSTHAVIGRHNEDNFTYS